MSEPNPSYEKYLERQRRYAKAYYSKVKNDNSPEAVAKREAKRQKQREQYAANPQLYKDRVLEYKARKAVFGINP